ncbi:MAG: hypothetical protein IKR78_01645 [Dehalococcoidales bacterium]|jgi:hypothetical protein|nr:hypothetical protein [Dehalococcoidales bacterium]
MINKENYVPMLCPVCEDFYFSELEDDEYSRTLQCSRCGWIYDPRQHADHDLRNGENEKSLTEYRRWFASKIAEDPNYDYLDEHRPPMTPHLCPVCDKYEFPDHYSSDICPFCGWEDDGTDEDDTDIIGPNDLKYSEYKKRYFSYINNNPNYKWEDEQKY